MTRFTQALIVLVPGWLIAYLTGGQIAYVAPVLVACGFLAAGLQAETRVDDPPDDGSNAE